MPETRSNLKEVRTVSKAAFTYGFPMVEGYKTLYAQSIDVGGKDFKAPFNVIGSTARVFTPEDKAFISPNSDTPYSFLWADLRAEPLVLTVPKIEGKRYYSLQFIDLFTQNFAYVGTRTTGQNGGRYLLAGPGWIGEMPPGVAKLPNAETEFAYVLYRTQLFGPQDLENVKAIQAGYRVESLSAFGSRTAPKPAPPLDWPKPSTQMTETPAFFVYLNFLLQLAPVHPSEAALRESFKLIGVGTGQPFDESKLPAEQRAALQSGIDDAWKEFSAFKKTSLDTCKVTSGDVFGSREFLKGNYLYRFAAAKLGIYGNSREEALYPVYFVDALGKSLDASTHNYVLNFTKDDLPPARSFWSVTMYDSRSELLVANPLKRYLINSTMIPELRKDAGGGITIYIQADSPGADKESNWLPAPNGPFYIVLRMYRPSPDAYDGRWQRPALRPIKRSRVNTAA